MINDIQDIQVLYHFADVIAFAAQEKGQFNTHYWYKIHPQHFLR